MAAGKEIRISTMAKQSTAVTIHATVVKTEGTSPRPCPGNATDSEP